MKYFLDSAKMDEIRFAFDAYAIDGITTNPKHVMNSGKTLNYFIREVSAWVKDMGLTGNDRFPISIEINPWLEKWKDMVDEGRRVAEKCENFTIKIPCTEEGLIAAHKLEQVGVRTNVTLVFSPSQALPVGRIGARFVSPFVGWKENSGEDTWQYVKDIADIYHTYDFKTEIIVAALRNGKQIADAAKVGADIVTCGLDVFKASFEHPFTDYGLAIFRDAWDHTVKEEGENA